MTKPKYLAGKLATIVGEKRVYGRNYYSETGGYRHWDVYSLFKLNVDGIGTKRRSTGTEFMYPEECFVCSGNGHPGKFGTWVERKKLEGVNGI